MDESSLEAKFSTTYYAILSGTYVDWRFQSENYRKKRGIFKRIRVTYREWERKVRENSSFFW